MYATGPRWTTHGAVPQKRPRVYIVALCPSDGWPATGGKVASTGGHVACPRRPLEDCMVWPRPVPCPELCSVLDLVATVTGSIEQMNLNKTYRNNLAAALARIDARPQKKENSVRLLRCGRSWRQQGSDGVEGGPLLDEKPRGKPCFLEHSGWLLSFYERVVQVASLGYR